jgi:hypothetical protein
VLEKQICSLSCRDERPSSTTGRNEIIDDRFWVSHDYQRLSTKIGRAARLLAIIGLPLSSNAEEWLRLRFPLEGEAHRTLAIASGGSSLIASPKVFPLAVPNPFRHTDCDGTGCLDRFREE